MRMVAYETTYHQKHARASLAQASDIERPTGDKQGGGRAVAIRKKREEISAT